MAEQGIYIFLIIFIFDGHFSSTSFVFHENTHISFIGENEVLNEYFGYSVLLSSEGSAKRFEGNGSWFLISIDFGRVVRAVQEKGNKRLYVGAPKAITEFKWNQTAGLVFICSLENLDVQQVICYPLGSKNDLKSKMYVTSNLLKNDSWFGASVALLAKDKLVIAAPRLTSRYHYQNYPFQLQGGCYLLTPKRNRILEPLSEGGKDNHQGFLLDGSRTKYGSSNKTVNYYSLGQAGFSLTVTKMNTLLLGAPGMMHSTGGIISYSFDPEDNATRTHLQPILNPYKTMDLEAADYFGYSAAAGIFEKNGTELFVGGAPRYDLARGKVLVFSPPVDELIPLDVKAKLLGPEIGSYFGASLCCTDINDDGQDDLLVGAPTYAKSDDGLSYDQGAVFIYMAEESSSGFVLKESGYVLGSGASRARFGTAIADLGDADDDGFRDIAIGAPWEDDGVGAVYIYMGNAKGLDSERVQRIQPAGARGFGWSISKGVDIDQNNCNDLAIGAYDSGTAYLYRCIPTIHVRALIRVQSVVHLAYNATSFTAMFCVSAPPTKFRSNVQLCLVGRINANLSLNDSSIIGYSQYTIVATHGNEICDEKTISVNVGTDLFEPILLTFELEADEQMKENSTSFLPSAARVSDDSILKVSQPVNIMRDCSDHLLCSPRLDMTLEALDTPYIPGTNKRFGVRLTAWNAKEPAYGIKVILNLPVLPKRIPRECRLQKRIMTCNIPQPFLHNEKIVWEIDLEYHLLIVESKNLTVTAEFSDRFGKSNITKNVKKAKINITPKANFSISGKSMPNEAITISRNNIASSNVSFTHHFEVTNLGPSDWHSLTANIRIPHKTHLVGNIDGCKQKKHLYDCVWSVPARVSRPVTISLQMDLSEEGNFLKQNLMYNATSKIVILLNQSNYTVIRHEVTTTLSLEPATIIWCIVTACILLGLLLLAIIVRVLYKCGFFLRTKYRILQAEKESRLLNRMAHTSQNVSSTQ